jgi:hypothetical protein
MSQAAHSHHDHQHLARRAVQPRPSLLRLSLLQRLAGVGVVVAAIWAGVLWALS